MHMHSPIQQASLVQFQNPPVLIISPVRYINVRSRHCKSHGEVNIVHVLVRPPADRLVDEEWVHDWLLTDVCYGKGRITLEPIRSHEVGQYALVDFD